MLGMFMRLKFIISQSECAGKGVMSRKSVTKWC